MVFIRVCFLKDDITRIFFISENASNNGICKDITGLGRWGNGDVELFMEHQDELDQIMEITIRSSAAEYLTYVASVGDQQDSIEMRYEDENIWLTQKMMATLYDVGTNTINYHIKKIFEDSELQEDSVIRKFRITAADGKSYSTNHYSLEMIIAVGFKVNSERAVQFRKWVNQIAKDYTIKGWVMDDERLKRGTYLTEKYFDEQLERIREIRASERKFYQKITDLYATAIDYDKNSATTRRFYATVQNKMHYAVHGHTAAELIVERADHTREHMGLATWADAPEGKIKKSDVTVAKNYLSQDEMKQLNRMVTAYLDFAENMTLRHIPLTMQDWEKHMCKSYDKEIGKPDESLGRKATGPVKWQPVA